MAADQQRKERARPVAPQDDSSESGHGFFLYVWRCSWGSSSSSSCCCCLTHDGCPAANERDSAALDRPIAEWDRTSSRGIPCHGIVSYRIAHCRLPCLCFLGWNVGLQAANGTLFIVVR